MGMLEAQGFGNLPSKPLVEPKENVNAITLRNGKQLDETPRAIKEADYEAP